MAERGDTGQQRAFAAAEIVNPTIPMLALGFSLLIAGGFGFHFPKGYIYAAMAFFRRGRRPQYARRTQAQTTAGMK